MTRVLIIEDEETYRETLGFLLQKEGFEVALAADGIAGLATYDRQGADIVLLDLMMPGMDGAETLRRIREAHGRNVAVVAMTADVLAIHRDDGLRAALDGFLPKPILPEALREALATVLRRA